MWLTILSDQLPVVALVSRYLTNKLMGRGLIPLRQVPKDPRLWMSPACAEETTFGITPTFARLFPTEGQIAHVLLTRSPLSPAESLPKD